MLEELIVNMDMTTVCALKKQPVLVTHRMAHQTAKRELSVGRTDRSQKVNIPGHSLKEKTRDGPVHLESRWCAPLPFYDTQRKKYPSFVPNCMVGSQIENDFLDYFTRA